MSYILEALKKLEQKQREQRGTIPDLLSSADTVPDAKRRPLWSYLVFAAFMMNAGLLIWWMHPWSAGTPKIVSPHIPGQGLHPEITAMSRVSSPIQTKTDRREKAEAKQAPTNEGKRPPMISPALHKQGPATHLSFEPLPVRGGSSEHKVFNLAELPSSVQQGLPEINISLHYYTAEPSSRMVRINDKTMREGQDLVAGLKLEEITPTGIVFSYQDYRFRIKAF